MYGIRHSIYLDIYISIIIISKLDINTKCLHMVWYGSFPGQSSQMVYVSRWLADGQMNSLFVDEYCQLVLWY